MIETAQAAEAAGIEEMWLWEDCFFASGIAPAAAILASTERLRVGIGLMPAALRAPSLTAMEIASIARMFPGRFLPGMGHGIQDWMAQIGAKAASPMTLLREQTAAILALLRGEEVTTSGRYVQFDKVRLNYPPEVVPPLYVGGRGDKTLTLAAELADGVILDDTTDEQVRLRPERMRHVMSVLSAGRGERGLDGFEVLTFMPSRIGASADEIAQTVGELGEAGATGVAVFAGGVDGPPASGQAILDLIEVLGDGLREQVAARS